MDGKRPIVFPIISQDDTNLVVAGCWSWMENYTLFPTIPQDCCIKLEFSGH
jgi:hypothetical protein